MRRTGFAIAAAAALVALALPGRAAAAACQTSGPAGGSYTATVCITAPADAGLLSGTQTVSATVSFTGTSPGIQRVIFNLDGQYLLTDYSTPYTFTLPTDRFVDGTHTLSAQALLRDTFTTSQASIGAQFTNGVLTPPVNTNSFAPTTGTAPAAGAPFVLAAAGDGAGGEQSESDVVSLIKSWNPNLFLYLGDVYEKGSPTEFYNWYRPSGFFGGLRSITDPTVGNHEYTAGAAPGYFDYWDNIPHYYSFDAAGWHIVSIDANGQFGQIAPGTAQYQWLANDLTNATQRCTLVYFHEPVFNIGEEQANANLQPLWQLIAQHGVDIVLNGHDHTYQRWTPLDGSGVPSATGTTELVAGTGGHALGTFITTDSRVVASATQFGALRMELNSNGAAFSFVTTQGQTLDSSSVQCKGTTDTTPPTTPTGLAATAPNKGEVDLTWTASTDSVGVTGYEVWRNGALLAKTPTPSYADFAVTASTAYQYKVRAYDAAGNLSGFSSTVSVTTPAGGVLFSDGFETGDLSRWSTVNGLVVQQATVLDGSWAARATSTGAPAYATATLTSPRSELYYQTRFDLVSQGANSVYLLRTRTGAGSYLATAFVSSTGKLGIRNDTAAATTTSTTAVTRGVWHTLQLHVLVNDTASHVDVWLDGVRVSDLSLTLALGTSPIGRVDLGDASSNRTYDVALDDVAYDGSLIGDTAPPTAPSGLAATSPSGLEVDLSWTPATDDVGVTGYDLYRNGTLLRTIPAGSSYADTSADPNTSYTYALAARDAAGNVSAQSAPATVSTGAIFSDGFESGGLGAWSSVNGLAAQQALVFSGSWAARATSSGSPASATRQLARGLGELYARARFDLVSQGANSVNLIRFRGTGTAPSLVTFFVTSTGRLAYRNDVTGVTTTSATLVGPGWHELQAHASMSDVAGRVDVWLDGTQLADLSQADTLGSTPIGSIELGDATSGRSFDVAFDDVLLGNAFIADTTPPSAPTGLQATTSGAPSVSLTWQPSTDNIAVTGYRVYRDGSVLATVDGSTTSYVDSTVVAGGSYSYTVRALDGAGNASDPSTALGVSLPAGDSAPPTAPGGLAAVTASANEIDLSWSASSDNVSVQAYRVYRSGAVVATVNAPATSYADTGVFGSTAYTYTVTAVDGSGNESAPSASASATTPDVVLFADGFESGDLSRWTSVDGLVTQSSDAFGGAWGAEASSTAGTAAWAYSTLPSPQPSVYYRIRFKLVSQGANNVNLLKFRTATGGSIVGVYVTSTGKLAYRNDAGSVTTTSTTAVAAGVWHELQVHAVVDGANDEVEIWLDSAPVAALTKPDTLGSTPVGRIQLGENSTGRVYDVRFDDVLAQTNFAADSTPPTAPGSLAAVSPGSREIDLSWTASTDDTGVAGYTVYRDGTTLATVGATATGYADKTVSLGTTYAYTVVAFDAAGNRSAAAGPVTATPRDTKPPTAPAVTASARSATRIDLSWSASTDDVGVTGYRVYRGGTKLADLDASARGYSDTGLAPQTSYSYSVTAIDAAGNESAGGTATATTLADTTPPAVPTGVAATVSAGAVDVSWTASTDDVGVTRYGVFRNGTKLADVTAPGTSYHDASIAAGQTYSYTVSASDAAGNTSAQSAAVTVTAADTTAPTAPTGLTATASSATRVDLTWTAATDNVGVTGYLVFRGGVQIAALGAVTSYGDTSVAANTAYSYTVKAKDAAGNVSAASAVASVTTPLFADGFESGTFAAWTSATGLLTEQSLVAVGSWAARATLNGTGAGFAVRTLATPQTNVYYHLRVNVQSLGKKLTQLALLRFKTATGTSIATLQVANPPKLAYRNDVSGQTVSSSTQLTTVAWHDLKVHLVVNGASGQIEVWLDGTKVTALSRTDNFGTAAIARIDLGDTTTGLTYDVAYDDVTLGTTP